VVRHDRPGGAIKDIKTFIRFHLRSVVTELPENRRLDHRAEDEGRPSYAAECRSLRQQLWGLENNVRFLGFQKVDAFYSAQLGVHGADLNQ